MTEDFEALGHLAKRFVLLSRKLLHVPHTFLETIVLRSTAWRGLP